MIREIELSLSTKDPEKLRDVWLAVYFDGFTKPFVLAPVADFFGCGVPPADDLEGLAIGKAGNRMWCRYPMPFASYAAIRLFNASHLAMDLKYNVTYMEGLSGDMTYFHARYNEAQTVMNEPYLAGRIHGTGHLVGASLAVHGATTFDFLEGGADVIVDKDYAGALRSMSTAAFFNCGLGLEGAPASSPCHGCAAKKTSYPVACSLYRGFLVDPIPFDQSVEVRFAHGNWNNKPGLTYASVLYWYQNEPNLEPWEMPRLTMSVEQ